LNILRTFINFGLYHKFKYIVMASVLKTPFSNLQQELLQLYSRKVSDEDLINIKELIGKYFAQRLTKLADDAWDDQGWTQQDMENILNDPNQ
jgi:hypothetical protein